MATLIILGNTNQYTFANSIVAANSKSKEVFQEALTDIFVFHSTDSQFKLQKEIGWVDHLRVNGIGRELFIERVVEIASSKESIERFVNYTETILKKLPENPNLMVDLTNGTTLQKSLLSVAAYILDIRHQYVIDIVKLSQLTKERGFLPVDVLLPSYVPAPDSTHLDSIAYLNLSEMLRYKRIIDSHTDRYARIDPLSSDRKFFKDNLIQSIQLKLQGDRTKDNAVYRIAAASISASVEDLIGLLISKLILTNRPDEAHRKTFGQKLRLVQSRIEQDIPSDFDLEFFRKFNDFILYLRNSATHKGRLLTDLEKFKADLSVKMSFPFIEFYTDIVHPILSRDTTSVERPKKIRRLSDSDIGAGETLYYGLDGDDTGSLLEELFISASDETRFRKLSRSVTKAVAEISKFIRSSYGKNSVIFEAGDDLLFKGYFDEQTLKTMQETYHRITSGLTCSIGYGRSFQEVYLALKLAKTQPGKNYVVGVEFY